MNSLSWMIGGYIAMLGLLALYVISLVIRAARLRTAIRTHKK
ncbi:MAG TPA: hypothetical protein PKG95_04580 [Anaerolineaceae bacterium]|jgi:hypothetical protein|nr:hypothetical protein [Anaerolineaceae bacterium]